MQPATVTKTCSRCKKDTPLALFYKRKGTKDGLTVSCKPCRYEIAKKSREKNIDKIKEGNKRYNKENRIKLNDKLKRWRKANPDKNREYGRKPEYRGARNATTARRRAAKLKATPKWANLTKIRYIYENCPPGHEVDHIIPLQSKDVCGLHVENNLQYLPISVNRSKSNKFEI